MMTDSQLVILLAEDTDDIRFMVKMMLEMKGYAVVEAADGQQVLDLVEGQAHPALILMDLNMPVMNGWEATRQLCSNPATRGIPIIGLSAHCQGEWHREAIEAGCDDCIQKPLDDGALNKVIARYLNQA
jgi:CheY-like chemotaxis protein